MGKPRKNKRALVIGLGNSLIGDDAFGPRVIEWLRSHPIEATGHAELAEAHTDLLAFIDRFPDYERVILVDAILDPEAKLGDPGRVVLVDEESMAAWSETSPSAHQFSPILAIKLFRSLNPSAKTQIYLVGLCVDRLQLPSSANPGGFALNDEIAAAGTALLRGLL